MAVVSLWYIAHETTNTTLQLFIQHGTVKTHNKIKHKHSLMHGF